LGSFHFAAESKFGVAGNRRGHDWRLGDGYRPTDGLARFIVLLMTPLNKYDDQYAGEQNSAQSVENRASFTLEGVAQPVKEAHGRVAEPIMLKFARTLFLILCHLFSSCKPA
jgi:hypothetical protein